MKPIVPFALLIAVGFMLAAGCIAMTSKNIANATTNITVTPVSITPVPVVNQTTNATSNGTASNSTLKGSLRVSISGISYPANLSVILDNDPVGTVQPTTPLYLMVPEGNHTVMVCMESVCEHEKVTTGFGKYTTVDFSERILRDIKFPDPFAQPSARIIDYYKNGNAIGVTVEFFNPSKKDLQMTASVSCGYSYIDDRTSYKMGDCAKGTLVKQVGAGQRISDDLALYFVSGRSISYSIPVIDELTIK
jgi:hypothetical protein